MAEIQAETSAKVANPQTAAALESARGDLKNLAADPFIADIANDHLDQIGHRHHPEGAAEFIDDKGHRQFAQTEFVQQRSRRTILRDDQQIGGKMIANPLGWRQPSLKQPAQFNDPDDVLKTVAVDRKAGKAAGGRQLLHGGNRGILGQATDIRQRDHHGCHRPGIDFEKRLQHPACRTRNHPLFDGQFGHREQILARGLRPAPAGHPGSQGVQTAIKPQQWRQPFLHPPERPTQRGRQPVGIAPRHRFRQDKTEDREQGSQQQNLDRQHDFRSGDANRQAQPGRQCRQQHQQCRRGDRRRRPQPFRLPLQQLDAHRGAIPLASLFLQPDWTDRSQGGQRPRNERLRQQRQNQTGNE